MARGWKKKRKPEDKYRRRRKEPKPRIVQYPPQRDEEGDFLPYCRYWWHYGWVPKEITPTCLGRDCGYLKKIYFDKGDKIPDPVKIEGLVCIAEEGLKP
jgi:hypothetical protein